jgi:hypothetical protein
MTGVAMQAITTRHHNLPLAETEAGKSEITPRSNREQRHEQLGLFGHI